MNKKMCCTCEVVVLLIKLVVFLTFQLSSPSLDLNSLNCTNDRFQQTGEISHFIKALRLRQLRVKLISRVVKESSDSFFQGGRRLISLQYSGMLSIFLRFHCLSPDMFCTAFGHAKHPRNIHASREVTLSFYSKNNSRRITYGIGCIWGMPSLSPLQSLATKFFKLLWLVPSKKFVCYLLQLYRSIQCVGKDTR